MIDHLKRNLSVLLVLGLVALLANCGGDDNGSPGINGGPDVGDLIGTWNGMQRICPSSEPESLDYQTMTFQAGGSGTWTVFGVSGQMTWSVDGDRLTATADWGGGVTRTGVGTFSVNGDVLTWNVEGDSRVCVYTYRNGTARISGEDRSY